MDRRIAAVLVLLLVPWTVQVESGDLFFVFPWGLASSRSLDVVTLDAYLFAKTGGFATLPARLRAWPLATVVYACAIPSAILARRRVVPGVFDWRVTAGLLAVAGLVHLQVTVGLLRLGSVAVPTGPILLFAVAWWTYRSSRHDGEDGT